SSISCSAGPTGGIWKKWSITQTLANPASSAVRAISESFPRIEEGDPAQLKLGIWSPIRIGSPLKGALAGYRTPEHSVVRNLAGTRGVRPPRRGTPPRTQAPRWDAAALRSRATHATTRKKVYQVGVFGQ